MGVGIGVLKVEFGGKGDDLLNLANVAFEDFDAGFCGEVPETHGAVVRGGEDGAGGGIEFDGIDPVGVAAQDKGGFILEIPNLDGLVPRA